MCLKCVLASETFHKVFGSQGELMDLVLLANCFITFLDQLTWERQICQPVEYGSPSELVEKTV